MKKEKKAMANDEYGPHVVDPETGEAKPLGQWVDEAKQVRFQMRWKGGGWEILYDGRDISDVVIGWQIVPWDGRAADPAKVVLELRADAIDIDQTSLTLGMSHQAEMAQKGSEDEFHKTLFQRPPPPVDDPECCASGSCEVCRR